MYGELGLFFCYHARLQYDRALKLGRCEGNIDEWLKQAMFVLHVCFHWLGRGIFSSQAIWWYGIIHIWRLVHSSNFSYGLIIVEGGFGTLLVGSSWEDKAIDKYENQKLD